MEMLALATSRSEVGDCKFLCSADGSDISGSDT